MRVRATTMMLCACACAAPALAQGTYVSASLTGDVVRFSRVAPDRGLELDSGEALGFALRVGTPLGASWGVEAEFARAAEIEHDGSPELIPYLAPSFPLSTGTTPIDRLTGVIGGPYDVTLLTPFSYRVRSSYQDVTTSAAIWARQDLTARTALVYVGGLAFHRTERDALITLEVPSPLPVRPIVFPSPSIRTITYSARPFAGIEARIAMGERIELVPGLRVHGLDGGVLVRPSVGLGWKF